MFTFDLAATLQGTKVTANAVHPATFMNTKMVSEAGIRSQSTVEEGAGAIVHLATTPDLENVSGRYFDRRRESRPLATAYDPAARRKLRSLSLELTGLTAEEQSGDELLAKRS
jgi:NAD(P)-dependent dehydrogenase (short-subunit alcohol dehydrogenase family)